MSILDDIAGLVADGLAAADLPEPATVSVVTPGVVDPDRPWVIPQPAVTAHACVGFVDDFTDYQLANGLVGAKDRKVMIVRTSLAIVPAPGMAVTIRGETYTIIDVKTDPANALWELQARSPGAQTEEPGT